MRLHHLISIYELCFRGVFLHIVTKLIFVGYFEVVGAKEGVIKFVQRREGKPFIKNSFEFRESGSPKAIA